MYMLETSAEFDSAHFLSDYHGKCENLHGHRWKVTVCIESEKLGTFGTEKDMVCDFSEFKKIVREEVARFDHMFLVEQGTLKEATIEALQSEGFTLKILPFRTTAENLARYFFDILCKCGLKVAEVQCAETPSNIAIYRP